MTGYVIFINRSYKNMKKEHCNKLDYRKFGHILPTGSILVAWVDLKKNEVSTIFDSGVDEENYQVVMEFFAETGAEDPRKVILNYIDELCNSKQNNVQLEAKAEVNDSVLKKEITHCGERVSLSCDHQCSKAWGRDNRPQQLDANGDWYHLADDELGTAPSELQDEEGNMKPRSRKDALNKWCRRHCERCTFSKLHEEVVLKDFSQRVLIDQK